MEKRKSIIAAASADSNMSIKRRKIMKRFIAVIMLLVTIFALSGCGGSSKCKVCSGTGYYQRKTCVFCGGTGYSDYDPYEHYKSIYD